VKLFAIVSNIHFPSRRYVPPRPAPTEYSASKIFIKAMTSLSDIGLTVSFINFYNPVKIDIYKSDNIFW
jgi:hypothetical protein